MIESIDRLNALLRGEMSAVETYDQAIRKASCDKLSATLCQCRLDHAKRVELLTSRILELGGEPSKDSGIWGAFARLMEGGAVAFGDKAAVDILEEGEDHGLEAYRHEMSQLDGTLLQLVETQLMPAQEQTHRVLRDLKHSMAA